MHQNKDFLLQFGNVAFFKAMLAEGFTLVACAAEGRYRDNYRIAALFAFYKPADAPRTTDFVQVPTWQVTKERALGVGEADYAMPREDRYSESALNEFLRRRRMVLGACIDLAGAVRAMETQAFDGRLAAAS